MNFTVTDIDMFVEIGQIGLHSSKNDTPLWIHSGLSESQEVIYYIQCFAVCCIWTLECVLGSCINT